MHSDDDSYSNIIYDFDEEAELKEKGLWKEKKRTKTELNINKQSKYLLNLGLIILKNFEFVTLTLIIL